MMSQFLTEKQQHTAGYSFVSFSIIVGQFQIGQISELYKNCLHKQLYSMKIYLIQYYAWMARF
jgi:hypothetical protein